MNIRVPWSHNIKICRASCSLRPWPLVPWSPLWWTPILRKSATRFLRPVRFHAIFLTAFFCCWYKCSNWSFNIDNSLELVSCLSFKYHFSQWRFSCHFVIFVGKKMAKAETVWFGTTNIAPILDMKILHEVAVAWMAVGYPRIPIPEMVICQVTTVAILKKPNKKSRMLSNDSIVACTISLSSTSMNMISNVTCS